MNPRAAPAALGSNAARLPSAQDAEDPGPKEKRGGLAPLPDWGITVQTNQETAIWKDRQTKNNARSRAARHVGGRREGVVCFW